jgi:hypothetical protein
MKKFSDFAKVVSLEGDKMKIDSILNKEIIIIGARISTSKYNRNATREYLTLQFKFPEDDKPHVIFTGSSVLISQIKDYKDEMPFESKIIKINRYYTLN